MRIKDKETGKMTDKFHCLLMFSRSVLRMGAKGGRDSAAVKVLPSGKFLHLTALCLVRNISPACLAEGVAPPQVFV